KGGDGYARSRMRVQYAIHIRTRAMNRAMDGEARRIDTVGSVFNDSPVNIDFHQVRGGHLLEQQSVWIEQEMLGAGNAGRDMRIDQIGHPELRDQAIGCGQVDPRLPLSRAPALWASDGGACGHDRSPLLARMER